VSAGNGGSGWRAIAVVLRKELVDALRDRRTLVAALISSVFLGPVLLVALSGLVASLEARAERREVQVADPASVPSLVNWFERQTFTVRDAGPGWEQGLRDGSRTEAVVVAPAGFEEAVVRGEQPVVEVVHDSTNQRSLASASRVERVLEGYARERATILLALRGVSAQVLVPFEVEARDLANAEARSTRITGMLPFFVMMAVLYGALAAALDSTAGERERGSLEPLLATPAERWTLVAGKWAAVATVAMGIAVLSCFSFLPGQWLLRSDILAALFRFGPREAALFLVLLLPFAAAVSAVLMAVAIRSRTFKEAQASSTVVVLAVSLLPLVSVFNLGAEAPWHVWVPALAQNVLMNRVLRGEDLTLVQMAVPLGVSVLVTAAGVAFVARSLRRAALQ
jgi:sodium transport system permease protein